VQYSKRMRRQISALLLGLIAAAVPADGQTCPVAAEVVRGATGAVADVRYLADDALAGRLAGSAGERCSGEYIAGEFAKAKLRPAGEGGTFFQSLSLASALNPHAPGGTGRNVIAAVDGADPRLKDEWIVIGAHYDHLGEGGTRSSLAPAEKAIHNGADDNASGVSVVLSAARAIAGGPRPARSVLFIAFTGEESGLLGSTHFVAHPTIAGRMTAMINLDMVGRLGTAPLIVYGVETAEQWRTLLEPAATRAGIAIATRGEGYGPSDHTAFYTKDIPVLHFFTNTHGDYHKPTDDADKIDAVGLEKVTKMVIEIASAVSARPEQLTLKRGAGKPLAANSAGTGGTYLGSVPDFSPVERGVKLSGVTPGSPADKAGVRAGDIIVGMAKLEVADLQGLTDALRAHKPGDTVPLLLIRDGKPLTLEVTLGTRTAR
jgi:peptidase M28-like protein/PDZ domain-containing protein